MQAARFAMRMTTTLFVPLRSIFRTGAERDIADNFAGMAVCKRGIQMIMAALGGIDESMARPSCKQHFRDDGAASCSFPL